MADLSLKLPYIPPNITQILSVLPQQVIEDNSVAQLKPLLSELLFGDYSHIEPHFFQELQHIAVLIELSAQYFAEAQDMYAEELEKAEITSNELKAENLLLKQRVGVLEERILSQKDEVSGAQIDLQRQNEQLKCEVFELKCQVKQLRRETQMNAEAMESLPVCEFCGKRFSDNEYLSKHVERRHPSIFERWCRAQLDPQDECVTQGGDRVYPARENLAESIFRIDEIKLPEVPEISDSQYVEILDMEEHQEQLTAELDQFPEIRVDAADLELLRESRDFLHNTQEYALANASESQIALSPPMRVEKPVILEEYYGTDKGEQICSDKVEIEHESRESDVQSFETVSENDFMKRAPSSEMRRAQ